MVPKAGDTRQETPVLAVPETMAWNCAALPGLIEKAAGLTQMLTMGFTVIVATAATVLFDVHRAVT